MLHGSRRCAVGRPATILAFVLAAALAAGGVRAAGPPAEWRKARIERFLLASMRQGGIDAWIVLTREGNPDPLSADLGFEIGRAALVFVDRGDRLETRAVVSALDLVPLRETGLYQKLIAVERNTPFEQALREALADLDVRRIGVNMSEGAGLADGLTATGLEMLKRALGETRAARLVSAETAILSFRSKKLPQEVALYRSAARETDAILREALGDGFLCPGRTTQAQLRDHVQQIAARRGYPETAWERPLCPGVYSGVFRDLSHAPASETVIAPGDILWVDFGIKDRGYATDVIRAAYLLREGESAAPAPVAAMFQAARAANRAAAAAMKPGVAGWQVDAVARESVVAAGYPEFFHGTGHPVGFDVHDAGPALAQKSRGNAALLPLEQDQVFAVEPSVLRPMPELRGSWLINIEEEVLVTATGGEYLSPPQEELILIPPACAHD